MYRDRFQPGLTVAELIEALQDLREDQQDLPVVFVCDYGDYSRTQQALPVQRVSAEARRLVPSAYSHSDWALMGRDDEDSDEDEDGEDADESPAPEAIILRM